MQAGGFDKRGGAGGRQASNFKIQTSSLGNLKAGLPSESGVVNDGTCIHVQSHPDLIPFTQSTYE
jgi:hypothetical protein